MKGSNKEFAKYLNTEYNDYSLEPLEKEKQKNNPSSIIRSFLNEEAQSTNASKTTDHEYISFQPTAQMVPLTDGLIAEFAMLLGKEARDYCKFLKHVSPVNKEILETYKEFYTKFQTVPVLFLSHVPEKGVYLWQINRLCPYKKESNHLILDSKALNSEPKSGISVLMLAKIVPEENEQLMNVMFPADGEICIKSITECGKLILRFYQVKDFIDLARVNPFKQLFIANERYSYRLEIKSCQSAERPKEDIEVSLWKKKTLEELQKELVIETTEDQEEQTAPILQDRMLQKETFFGLEATYFRDERQFEQYFKTQDDIYLFIDKKTATIIAWKEEGGIIASSYKSKIRSVYQLKVEENKLFTDDSIGGKTHEISFDRFPNVNVIPLPQDKLDHDFFSRGRIKNIQKENLVYDVPISLVNPYLAADREAKKNKEKNSVEKVKHNENLRKTLDKIQLDSRNQKSGKREYETELKVKKDMLKEIRTDICSKMKEVKSFDEEYRKTDEYSSKPKTIKEPQGVSKETLKLYDGIKTDKKRMEKKRDKEKTQIKNDKVDKNGYC